MIFAMAFLHNPVYTANMHNPSINTKIGNRVAAARDQAGFTQEALSRRLGFKDRQTLSAIESGTRKIGPEELIAIMELTGKELDFFSDPYRLDGEGAFSFRTTSEDPDLLSSFEEKTGRFLALYQKLSAPDAAKPSPMTWCLKPSYDSSYDEADDAAEWLIREWKLGVAPARAMIRSVETHMPNLRVFYIDPPEGISGAACRLTGLDVILINRNDNPARRNFDFAHELFHILTWDRMPPARMDVAKPLTEKGKRAEKLANKFASRLLMPTSALKDQWQQRDTNLSVDESLHKVGAFFQASAQAVYWRLVNDGLLHKKEVQNYRELPDPDTLPESCPPLYSEAYMKRLSEGLQAGRLTVRKAGNILGLTIDELSDLFQEYNLKPPFEL